MTLMFEENLEEEKKLNEPNKGERERENEREREREREKSGKQILLLVSKVCQVLFLPTPTLKERESTCGDPMQLTGRLNPRTDKVKSENLSQLWIFSARDLQLQFCIPRWGPQKDVTGRKYGVLRPQKPLRLIRDGGELGGSGVFKSDAHSLHCHHQNDSASRWAAV